MTALISSRIRLINLDSPRRRGG